MGRPLSALDIAFLGLETQRTPVNVAALQVLEIPQHYEGNFVRDLLDELSQQPPGPPFNLKLGRGSLLPLPHWVVDEHFDIDYHLRHSALPRPGDMAELLALVSRLHSRVMDRERPLWEFHLIEGLRKNRFAIYMKMHHAAIDGMGGIAMLEACYGKTPEAPVKAPWQGFGAKQRRNTDSGLLGSVTSIAKSASEQIRMAPDLAKLLTGQAKKALGMERADAPVLFSAPKSLFNGHISGARRFVVHTLSLDKIKDLAKTAETTVNDVILCLCSGVLRRYLLDKDALPEKTLVATVPVSIRQINRAGNQITYVGAQLATDQKNPLRRLKDIQRSTVQAKAEMAAVDPSAATAFAVLAQGTVAVLNRFRLADLLPPPANVVISNLPGPRHALYFGGARMLSSYPLSVLVDGQAINITVVSYCGNVDFGLMACRESVPDVEDIAGYLDEVFDELSKAVTRRHKTTQRKKTSATTRKRSNGKAETRA